MFGSLLRKDKGVHFLCLAGATFSTLLVVSVFIFIVRESWPAWKNYGFILLVGEEWNPVSHPPALGLAPMIASTLWVAIGATLLATPLGIGAGVFLAEFAPSWVGYFLRPLINLLTGIPSVIYGFVGASLLVPLAEKFLGINSGESLFTASLVLAIMILPYLVGTLEGAFRALPKEYREAALALGVSPQYLVFRISLPLSRKALLASLLLCLGRAAGETMAVLMLAGNVRLFPLSWFAKGEPLSALIALETGTAARGTVHYNALFAAGLVLLLLVFAINLALFSMKRYFREVVKID